LDRIYRIIRISFLRHFPEESGETQSRHVGGKNINDIAFWYFIFIIKSGAGEFFYSKLVIPAQAGIQKCSAEKTGCPPARE
jgi:hypothetical protein